MITGFTTRRIVTDYSSNLYPFTSQTSGNTQSLQENQINEVCRQLDGLQGAKILQVFYLNDGYTCNCIQPIWVPLTATAHSTWRQSSVITILTVVMKIKHLNHFVDSQDTDTDIEKICIKTTRDIRGNNMKNEYVCFNKMFSFYLKKTYQWNLIKVPKGLHCKCCFKFQNVNSALVFTVQPKAAFI